MQMDNPSKRERRVSTPTAAWTKEAAAVGMAILALMLTPLLNGVYIFLFVSLAVVIYAFVFRSHLSALEVKVAAAAFAVAFVVAVMISMLFP